MEGKRSKSKPLEIKITRSKSIKQWNGIKINILDIAEGESLINLKGV